MADSDPISMVMWVVDAELAFGWGCLSHFANFSFCETGACGGIGLSVFAVLLYQYSRYCCLKISVVKCCGEDHCTSSSIIVLYTLLIKDGMRLNIYRIWLIHIVTLMVKDGMRQNIINLWLAVCSIFLLKHTVYSVIGFQLLERSIITIVPNGHAFASSRTKGQRKRTIDYHFKKKKLQNYHA